MRRRHRRKRRTFRARNLFPERLDRPSYLLRFVFSLVISLSVVAITNASAVSYTHYGGSFDRALLAGRILFALSTVFWLSYARPFILAPRLRDAGMYPWVAVFGAIPVLGFLIFLYALFAPTYYDAQDYGAQNYAQD